MAEDLHPDAIRARTFTSSRRGFDRAEVEAFQEQVAGRVAELEDQLGSLQDRVTQLGITELSDLKQEFDTVGEDVREILQAARDAAEDMRQRASADATKWRSAAEAEVEELKDAARQEAEAMRGEAWEASTLMLEESKEAAAAAAAKANEDVLFVRAEAEREALRLTGDAKRDSEEVTRAAQIEAEKLVEAASEEAETARAEAKQAADLAQERVKALEERREELLAELEQTRETLTELEDRIEGRQAELTHATTDPADSAVRVITEEDPAKPEIGDWLDEDATVRLVPPPEQMPPPIPIGLVDADDLVAEVESLRSAPSPEIEPIMGRSGSSAEAASLDFEITSGDVAAVADSAATAEIVPVSEVSERDAPEATPEAATTASAVEEPDPEPESQAEPEAEAAEEPAAAAESEAAQPLESEEPESAQSDDAESSSDTDGGIDDLFASLRSGPVDAAPEPVEPEAPPSATQPTPSQPLPEAAAEPAATPPAAAVATATDPWDLRDRSLMPVTNEVLRGIKRQIVDLQNAVLEELRTESQDWRPKRAMFDRVLDDAAEGVAARSYGAGVSAAGELAEQAPPALGDGSTHDLVSLATDLWEAVVDAIEATQGGTNRERGASVGRIFRAWRTDEAERRVRQVAHAEYNAGVAAGLDSLGVGHAIEPQGRDIADPDAIVVPA